MIPVAGYTHVDPARREQALAGAKPLINGAISQRGCRQYSWTPSPQDPARIRLFEVWDGLWRFARRSYAALQPRD